MKNEKIKMQNLNFLKTPEFEEIFSFESLLKSWQEFKRRKSNKADVAEFAFNLISNLSGLRSDIISGKYKHGGYSYFRINDPKPRDIHKASVRDRIVHHVLYRVFYPYFDHQFIYDSYACRENKGQHLAIKRFASMIENEGASGRRTVWVLKCDIKKFFASIDQEILRTILSQHIKCARTIKIVDEVLGSFKCGLPLGNLTSQLFGNVYMNELDQYIKSALKVRSYIRYADDFVILSRNKAWLEELLPKIGDFLEENLALDLHADKIFIKTIFSGVDFLGWMNFNNHRVLRTKTKNRMLKTMKNNSSLAVKNSYLGLLKHGNSHKLRAMLESQHE